MTIQQRIGVIAVCFGTLACLTVGCRRPADATIEVFDVQKKRVKLSGPQVKIQNLQAYLSELRQKTEAAERLYELYQRSTDATEIAARKQAARDTQSACEEMIEACEAIRSGGFEEIRGIDPIVDGYEQFARARLAEVVP